MKMLLSYQRIGQARKFSRQPGDDFVIDRFGPGGPIVCTHPLAAVFAQQRYRVARTRAVRAQVDHRHIHTDAADDRAARAVDLERAAIRESARYAVGISERYHADARTFGCMITRAVADWRARVDVAHGHERADHREGGLEIEIGTVHRDLGLG